MGMDDIHFMFVNESTEPGDHVAHILRPAIHREIVKAAREYFIGQGIARRRRCKVHANASSGQVTRLTDELGFKPTSEEGLANDENVPDLPAHARHRPDPCDFHGFTRIFQCQQVLHWYPEALFPNGERGHFVPKLGRTRPK
ncbi:hypothetical protein GCM10023174_08630 [Chelativorans composti]